MDIEGRLKSLDGISLSGISQGSLWDFCTPWLGASVAGVFPNWPTLASLEIVWGLKVSSSSSGCGSCGKPLFGPVARRRRMWAECGQSLG